MRVHGNELLRYAIVLADEERVHDRQVGLLIGAAIAGHKARRLALAVLLVIVAGQQVPADSPPLHPQPTPALVPEGNHQPCKSLADRTMMFPTT